MAQRMEGKERHTASSRLDRKFVRIDHLMRIGFVNLHAIAKTSVRGIKTGRKLLSIVLAGIRERRRARGSGAKWADIQITGENVDIY